MSLIAESVSYTHLDVYKRQLLPRAGVSLVPTTEPISGDVLTAAGTAVSGGLPAVGSPAGAAVSYTHLDVYKRQIQWNVDSLDWKDYDAGTICKRVRDKLCPGSIVLFHNCLLYTSPPPRRWGGTPP